MAAARGEPVNLTAASDRLPWAEVGEAIRVRSRRAGALLEIRGLEGARMEAGDAADRVYVVVSGYGVLHWDGGSGPFTGGDVLFVPAGCAHRFEGLEGEIRLWRILLLPGGPPGGPPGGHSGAGEAG